MKKQTFEIVTFTKHILEVQGYPFTISGFEEIGFFVHKQINTSTLWSASEITTGRAIAVSLNSRKAAMTQAITNVTNKGLESLKDSINKSEKLADLKREISNGVMQRMTGTISSIPEDLEVLPMDY